MDYIEVRTETTHDAAELLAELLAEITGGARWTIPKPSRILSTPR